MRIRFALLEFVVSFARNILSVLNRHVLSEIGWKRMKLYDFVTNVHCLLQNHPDRMNTHKFVSFLVLIVVDTGRDKLYDFATNLHCLLQSQPESNEHP